MPIIIPTHVLELFCASGKPKLLPGGQGTTFCCGSIVMKPCDNPIEWNGLAPLLCKLNPVGYRLARPIQASDDRWEVDGWMATRMTSGTSGYAGHEAEALTACRCFHQELSEIYHSNDCPNWLGSKNTAYRKADRIAWGEEPWPQAFTDEIITYLKPIKEALHPIDLPYQITHGDPGGDNILFAENLAPALIDIAPYWRPAGYAIAMMFADGIAWRAANHLQYH